MNTMQFIAFEAKLKLLLPSMKEVENAAAAAKGKGQNGSSDKEGEYTIQDKDKGAISRAIESSSKVLA